MPNVLRDSTCEYLSLAYFNVVVSCLLGPLHMSPVDQAGSVTEMKLGSVHMVTFSPLSEMKNFEQVVTRPFRREI